MTRETRIGLLVALAFIIAFGLVLSELTGKSSPAGRQIKSAIEQANRTDFSPIVDRAPVRDGEAARSSNQPQAGTPGPDGEALSLTAQSPAVVDVDLLAAPGRGAGDGVASALMKPPADTTPHQKTYTVQPNDSLRKIARKFYGDEQRYKDILRANREALGDESLITIGQELVLPEIPAAALAKTAGAAPSGREGLPRVPPQESAGYSELELGQLQQHFREEEASAVTAQPQSAKAEALLPARNQSPPSKAEASSAGAPPAKMTESPATVKKASKPAERVYVVQAGDSLTKIARQLMNDGSSRAVHKLFEVNRDKLASPDELPVGVELNIPS